MRPEDIFRRKKADHGRLLEYGFKRSGGGYSYSEPLIEGLRADVSVDRAGRVSCHVIDTETGEEYLPVLVEVSVGSFVGAVREAYTDVLTRISEACFSERGFDSDQACRIADRIEELYGEVPDHPFGKLPEASVFRYPDNRKWYALVMELKRSLLAGDSDEQVEVMNLKADPDRIEELISQPGIYPGYHMNRKNWISVILDDTVDDEYLLGLITASRGFAVNAGRKNDTSAWIIPASPSYCEIPPLFAKKKGILWWRRGNIAVGDTVFVYVAAPVSAVKYRCVVTSIDPDDRMMTMDLEREYDDGFFPFADLKRYGIRAVRGARTVPPEFLKEVKRRSGR